MYRKMIGRTSVRVLLGGSVVALLLAVGAGTGFAAAPEGAMITSHPSAMIQRVADKKADAKTHKGKKANHGKSKHSSKHKSKHSSKHSSKHKQK